MPHGSGWRHPEAETINGFKTSCNAFFIAVYGSAETHKRLVRPTRVNWFDSNMWYKIIESAEHSEALVWYDAFKS